MQNIWWQDAEMINILLILAKYWEIVSADNSDIS